MLKRLVRKLAVRYRRFMQAEMMDYLHAQLGSDQNASLAQTMEAALLTIALHAEDHRSSSNISQSELT
jgi:hypothetical protein